ncbi:hypothetical protein Q3Y53_06095 [Synechococcus sp. YX-04-1]|uniref:hypothetical protein n=1 Tax=Synechococcus sp. YX-04-1 TaxID=3062778 RepID=UPI0026E44577|nr:hypothetical protein [Synechococcus sp. YX-04-1]MDO6352113.1 hypothetical protein [Synechococcus sp. YX-04-1]
MPRVNQIVGRLMQVAAIASIPSCYGLVGVMDISPTQFYISKDAPNEYKALIGTNGRVRPMSDFPSLGGHIGPQEVKQRAKLNAVREASGKAKLPLPKNSRLTSDADYCRVSDSFNGGERRVSCYAGIGDKVEKREFHEYVCKVSPSSCGIIVSDDQRFTASYQQASDISQELFADSVTEYSAFMAMLIAFTSPIWLFLGGWIAKQETKN